MDEQRYIPAHGDGNDAGVRSRSPARGKRKRDPARGGSDRGDLPISSQYEDPAERREKIEKRPSRRLAEAAVRTLIRWAGDDPRREGLRGTPARVVRSYEELFAGYAADPRAILARTFADAGGYDEMIVLRDIRVVSCCEHHMLPVVGKACVGYLPSRRVVGISKLTRIVQGFSRRLQLQERLVSQIAAAVQDVLKPRGVGVIIQAEHSCMTLRGVNQAGTVMTCSRLLGDMRTDPSMRAEFLGLAGL